MREYFGNHYIFRLDGAIMSGYFCGIGEVNGNYGMIFVNVKCSGIEISHESCLLVKPSRIKCTLYSDMIDLRCACRKTFQKMGLTNNSNNIYFPTHKVNELTNEKRTKTTG